jgi:GGDEF domain-containing protein
VKSRKALEVFGFGVFSLAVCVAVTAVGLFLFDEVNVTRQRDADTVLAYFQQTMTQKLRSDLSQGDTLAAAIAVDPTDDGWFPAAAERLLEQDGAAYFAYLQGETMRYALPESSFGDTVGRDLVTFSYVYTLGKVTDDFVVEGPVELTEGNEVFLFVRPFDVDGVYYGEVIVGLDAAYVIEQLDFASLEEQGYRYELWAVSPQDGSKDVIAVSEGATDFSQAVKLSFNMPTLWTLSLVPVDGWVPRTWAFDIVGGCTLVALLVIALAGTALILRRTRRQAAQERLLDPETGLLTYAGFLEALERNGRRRKGPLPLTLICLSVDDFERTALALGWAARNSYLESVKGEIAAVVQGSYDAARVSGGSFVVCVYERIDRRTLGDMMRALELALLWKARIDGKKVFCRVRSAAVSWPEDGADAAALVERTVSLLERDRT